MSRAFEPELDWSKERSLLLQRIELLQEQIGEFNKREEDNKKFSDTLMTVVNDLSNEQSRNREAELEIRNQQLQQQISNVELRHQDIVQHYETQLEDLKHEIREMRRENSQLLVEMERNKINGESKLRLSQEALHERDMRIDKLERELQQEKIVCDRGQKEFERLRERYDQMTTQAEQQPEDSKPTRRRESSTEEQLRASHLSTSYTRQRTTPTQPQEWIRTSPAHNTEGSENNMNVSNLNQRRQRVQQFMKKDKNELKLMVSTLLKAKGQLEVGGQNLSYMERSTHRSSFGQSANRTFLK